jgi:hypothetical protein
MTRIRALSATTTVVLAASLLASAPAHASPGDLDRSFSGDGIVLTGFGGEIDGGAAVAVQVDAKAQALYIRSCRRRRC